jgi:uncharacterized membrane protein
MLEFIRRLSAVHKLLIALTAGVLVLLLPVYGSLLLHIIAGWDAFCLVQLLLWWITFYHTAPKDIRKESGKQDESRYVIFALVLAATCVSMLAVVILLTDKSTVNAPNYLPLTLALGCMVLSWILLHTIYTLRYAHMYYADDKTDGSTHAGGLLFPEEEHPDFIDFAYFSFILGMTFQVSDVSISSRPLRRLALWHSLLSFAYNATIIALTVNVIAGLTG